MKKSTKITLIIIAVFLATGLLLVIIAGLLGGGSQVKGMAENGELCYNWPFHWNVSSAEYDYDGEDDYEDVKGNRVESDEKIASVDEIKNLQMNLGAGKFEIVSSSDDNYYVEDSSNNRIYVNKEGSTLILSSPERKHWWWNKSIGTATIYIPEKELESLEINLGAGTIDLETDLSAEHMSIEIGAGELDGEDLTANDMSIEVGAGSCELGKTKAQDMKVELAMGEYSSEAEIDNSLSLEVAMGSASLEIDGDEKDFNYEVDCGAGEVELDGFSAAGISADKTIDNDAEKNMNIECGMGSVEVRFN